MQSNSSMILKKYFVDKILFQYNHEFDAKDEVKIPLSPQFARHIEEINDNLVKVSLDILIEDNENKLPFSLDIRVCGVFYLEKWQEKMDFIKNNAIAILFPYLRSLVTTVTANSNIPPYILPVMNIIALFEQSEKNNE